MAPVATPLEIGGRSQASGDMRGGMFFLVPKAATAIEALDPIEARRLSQLKG